MKSYEKNFSIIYEGESGIVVVSEYNRESLFNIITLCNIIFFLLYNIMEKGGIGVIDNLRI